MSGGAKYFIVEAEAMPEIIRKVAEAKRLLETGEKTTVNGAAREVGISRSAFYKYKDAVHPFQDMLHGRIVTLQTVLRDEPRRALRRVERVRRYRHQYSDHQSEHPGQRLCGGDHHGGGPSALRRSLEELLAAAGGSPGVLRCEILAG